MKILLVNPPQSEVYGGMVSPDYPPLGLSYLGAVLEKANHDVKIIDIDADKISNEQFVNILKEGYELIGFTATTPTFKRAEEFCRVVKENSNIITVLGGIHATIIPEDCIKSKFIDFVIRGEGEATILDLIDAIQNKNKFEEVDGIAFRKNNEIIYTM